MKKTITPLDVFNSVNFSVRVLVFLSALVLAFFVVMAGARKAEAAALKPKAVISGQMLTLGDIFDGLRSDQASYVLGPAPQPGQDMILNARTLLRIARAMELSWQPASTTDQIIIRREATIVNGAAIENATIAALQDNGIEDRFTLHFTGGQAPELVLPSHSAQHVEIIDIHIDRQNGLFSAIAVAPSAENPLAQMAISGQIEHLVTVPVLKKTLREGDMIGARDLDWIDISVHDVQPDLVLSAEELVGMTPRRMALAGQPLRLNDLQPPQLVSRGSTVTITYQDGPITLTAKGKALQSGAKDDLVRVVNIASNRTIEGFISDDHVVTVMP